MIPSGTAVRDAHACYEVVVPVTVPDKPRLAPCCLLLPLPPPIVDLTVPYTPARTRTKFHCGIVGDYDI
jgi:hypothetical protein